MSDGQISIDPNEYNLVSFVWNTVSSMGQRAAANILSKNHKCYFFHYVTN